MRLHYSKLGNGPALLILHGLYGQGDNWMNIARELAESYTVYLIDQRNHGKSPHAPSHTYDDMADDLHELCISLNLDRFILLGHSMGGKTAMTFTLKYPGIVQKLISVDISPYSYLNQKQFEHQINFHKTILKTFQEAPVALAKTRTEIEMFFSKPIGDISVRKFLLKNLKRSKEGKFYWQLNIVALSENLEDIIGAASPVKFGTQSYIPILFIRGGKSPYISIDEMGAIPDVFPNAQFTTFENAGHWLHAEEPERFIETVRQFLQD